MLFGVLAIGSNSAQLQVFETRPGAPPLPTHAVKEPTLLGEAFGPDGAIDPAGVDRVVEAVNHAMSAARRSRVISALSGAALLAASAATRWGVFHAGLASADDPKYTVIPQRERLRRRDRPSAGSS